MTLNQIFTDRIGLHENGNIHKKIYNVNIEIKVGA